jgi:hypothetical protein
MYPIALTSVVTKLFAVVATCVVDGTAANTFDNNTYPIRLGKCWHVMMIDTPKEPAHQLWGPGSETSSEGGNLSSSVAVLVRGSNSGLQKVSIPSFIRFVIRGI